jgi:hypothetical protein
MEHDITRLEGGRDKRHGLMAMLHHGYKEGSASVGESSVDQNQF